MNAIKNVTISILICISLFSGNQLKGQSIELGTVAAELGDTVLVPINISGMQNLGAISLIIIYDPVSLEFLELSNIIPEANGILGAGGYQPLVDTNAITVGWYNAGVAGIDFPDGKMLDLKLVFNNTNGTLNFFINYCEIVDWDLNVINVGFTNGGIFVNQGASESIWTGTGEWSDESHWSQGIPGSITKAIINDGAVNILSSATSNKLIVNSGADVIIQPNYSFTVFDSVMINGNFIIKSDETGAGSFINMGEIVTNGSVSVERFISNGEHLISSPVAGATAATFTGLTLYSYGEPAQLWNTVAASDPLEVGFGYKTSGGTNSVYTFSGNMNYGDIQVTGLSYTTSGGNDYPVGMNVCGNPFPSAIAWNSNWIKTNIDAAVYVYNGTQFISWNGEIGQLEDGIIPAHQGFIIFANDINAELTIPNTSRLHNDQSFYKDIINMAEFTLSGNGYEDKIYLQYKTEALYSFDHQYDAYKIFGSNQAIQLYTFTSDGAKVSINVIPDISLVSDTAIRIGFSAPTDGEYDFRCDVNTFTGTYDLYLRDIEADSNQRLLDDTLYSFSSSQGFYEDRFLLYFKKPSAIGETSDWNVNIFSGNGSIFVILDDFHRDIRFEVFDLLGHRAFTEDHHNVKTLELKTTEKFEGIYIVRLISGHNVYTRKLFLK